MLHSWFRDKIPASKKEALRALRRLWPPIYRKSDPPIVWWTAALCLVAVVSATISYFQWRALARTDETTREALISVQRAFVVIKDFKLQRIIDTKRIPAYQITPLWENSGLTPTREMVTNGSWALFKERMPEDYKFPDMPGIPGRRLLLGPKAAMNGGSLIIPSSVFDQAKKGINRLYIWGWADYNDIFRNTARHRTEFCSEILITGDPHSSDLTVTFGVCDRFNGADSETMRKPEPYPDWK